eukprot:scaffold228617_cov19-Tisochrysis_lutea.AAC.3
MVVGSLGSTNALDAKPWASCTDGGGPAARQACCLVGLSLTVNLSLKPHFVKGSGMQQQFQNSHLAADN